MAMTKKPKYKRSDEYRYQYIRAHPEFLGKYYLCPYYGRIMMKKTIQVDHIVSISLTNEYRAYRVLVPGGNINNLHNLTASCPKCNSRKSDSGGFWISLARFGVAFYAAIWLLLLGSLHGLPLVLSRDTFRVDFFFRMSLPREMT